MIQVVKHRLGEASWLRIKTLLEALWGTVMICLCAQISIPLEPVPITLQTYGVMLVGLTLSRRAAVGSMASYLVLGALGVPIFAEYTGGIHILVGPTGGYLVGCLVSVLLMSTLRHHMKHQSLWNLVFTTVLGTVTVFMVGVPWLATFVGMRAAIEGGFLPFILPGAVKAVLLVLSVRYLKFGHLFRFLSR